MSTNTLRKLRVRVRNALRELDKNESIRRKLRTGRNFVKELPPRNSELVFESWQYTHPLIEFKYLAKGKYYISAIELRGIEEQEVLEVNKELWSRVMLVVGLAFAPYHFLRADFRTVKVACGCLSEQAIDFYQRYFVHGLAEFRYRQGLNPNRPIKIVSEGGFATAPAFVHTNEKLLMLNGGGKDTAVMCELLKTAGIPLAWLCVNPKGPQRRISEISEIKNRLDIQMRVDPSIFVNPTYPWGHMPTSGMLLSVAMIPAIVKGYKYVTTGNECSANEGNVRFRGVEINHQYTKSHDFETEFNQLIESFVGSGVHCFSALRMFHDIQIAGMLRRYHDYVGEFVSCNKGSGWCNDCEKCAFVYMAMSAFFGRESLVKVFGADLWDKPRTRALMLHLMTSRVKRWECVGTQQECKLAALMHFEQYGERDFNSWPFMTDLKKAYVSIDREQVYRSLMLDLNPVHNIPPHIATRIAGEFRKNHLGAEGNNAVVTDVEGDSCSREI